MPVTEILNEKSQLGKTAPKSTKNESNTIYSMVNLVVKGSKLQAWHNPELHTGEPIPY